MRSAIHALAAIILSTALAACVTSERIQFPTATDTMWGPESTRVPALFFKPQGAGPFPAVVILPTDAGLTPHVTDDWPKFLTMNGYAVMTVDSYTPRRMKGGGDTNAKWIAQSKDAYGALDYLAARVDIDPDRIAVIGFSNGAVAIGELMMRASARPAGAKDFKAAVSVYGRCRELTAFNRDKMPLLIIAAERDIRLNASCINAIKNEGYEGVILKGAYHGFDSSGATHDPFGNEMHYSGDATNEAHRLVLAFLKKHLGLK
jgi:dienelactone hydrolase